MGQAQSAHRFSGSTSSGAAAGFARFHHNHHHYSSSSSSSSSSSYYSSQQSQSDYSASSSHSSGQQSHHHPSLSSAFQHQRASLAAHHQRSRDDDERQYPSVKNSSFLSSSPSSSVAAIAASSTSSSSPSSLISFSSPSSVFCPSISLMASSGVFNHFLPLSRQAAADYVAQLPLHVSSLQMYSRVVLPYAAQAASMIVENNRQADIHDVDNEHGRIARMLLPEKPASSPAASSFSQASSWSSWLSETLEYVMGSMWKMGSVGVEWVRLLWRQYIEPAAAVSLNAASSTAHSLLQRANLMKQVERAEGELEKEGEQRMVIDGQRLLMLGVAISVGVVAMLLAREFPNESMILVKTILFALQNGLKTVRINMSVNISFEPMTASSGSMATDVLATKLPALPDVTQLLQLMN